MCIVSHIVSDLQDALEAWDEEKITHEDVIIMVETASLGPGRVIVVPSCPTCSGTGNRNRIENTDYKAPWACPDCNGSGHHPDTIKKVVEAIKLAWFGKPPDFAIQVDDSPDPEIERVAITVLDALTLTPTGDTE